ncbi:hypothetical protein LAZ67_5003165 [Cordylochernes scorpioides]|uniref:ATP-dependent DNA helicase n=1 Tax=Cordylochernes scorpioides TaxID=51811 RepID=A0ABY6KH20_9ARAC|nr:hypothetical protein LAZ67_5003165 [Cordylochernes scorpioides]
MHFFHISKVLIPRSFKFRSLQFPVMVAFAMTINKSQGQTLQIVGVHLESPFLAWATLCSMLPKILSSLQMFHTKSPFFEKRETRALTSPYVDKGSIASTICETVIATDLHADDLPLRDSASRDPVFSKFFIIRLRE